MSKEEKIPIMREWYRRAHELLMKEDLTRDHLKLAVARARLQLRGGCEKMLRTLSAADVPVTVFSAGLGAVIHEIFEQKLGGLLPHMEVIANRMDFGPDGHLQGIQDPVIHMFNKDVRHAKGSTLVEEAASRHNVILMGDGVGDATMADGVDVDTVLKVGFLNDRVDELLPTYLRTFDVVITNDGGVDYVNDLIRDILATP